MDVVKLVLTTEPVVKLVAQSMDLVTLPMIVGMVMLVEVVPWLWVPQPAYPARPSRHLAMRTQSVVPLLAEVMVYHSSVVLQQQQHHQAVLLITLGTGLVIHMHVLIVAVVAIEGGPV